MRKGGGVGEIENEVQYSRSIIRQERKILNLLCADLDANFSRRS